jgi:hypothetical protein
MSTNGKTKKDKSKCVCREWVTGGIALNFVRDAADGRVLEVRTTAPFPAKTAVSPGFVGRMTAELPGMAEWQGPRLIIRTSRREHAYRKVGECPGCGYVLLRSEGAA